MPKIEMWYDGACEPVNPGGHGGAGVVIKSAGKTLFSQSKHLGSGAMSSNVAEYAGMIAGLEWLIQAGHAEAPIQIYGDNRMSVMQMAGKWKAKKGMYIPSYLRCKALVAQFPCIAFTWIPREQNTEADVLSKKALLDAGVLVVERSAEGNTIVWPS